MSSLNELFDMLWLDYAAMNTQAGMIHEALEKRGEKVINDHVAFRTFDFQKTGIPVLAKHFTAEGYEMQAAPYEFKEKKLTALHFQHPDPKQPKIFISALKVKEFSRELQNVIDSLISQIPADWFSARQSLVGGIPWKPVSHNVYQKLLAESEYAAWMSAFGFRVNHFTVFFNELKTFKDMADLNHFIRSLGFDLNGSGGEIKGTPGVYLEQSSTLAHQVSVKFADKEEKIPGCYYEFARRYPLPGGKLFQGFVTQSADKIFESTNRRD